MNRFKLAAALLLSTVSALSAHAQMPTDNAAWSGRCAALSTVVDPSRLTPTVKALTHGLPASKFTTFAFDRSAANQPAVACTMFYLSAIAAANANDASAAHDNAVLAGIEMKTAHHQDTSFSESLVRIKVKAHEISKSALTVDDEEKMLAAATTVPYSQANTASVRGNSNHPGY